MGRVILSAVFAFIGFVGFVQASPLPNGGITADEVAAVLKARGLPVEIGKDSIGEPEIMTSVEDVKFWIQLYNCKSGRCASIQFVKGYDLPQGLTYEKANDWNTEYRFGKMNLDDEKDPFVRMDLDVERGGTTELIDNNIDMWIAVLAAFGEFLDKAANEIRS